MQGRQGRQCAVWAAAPQLALGTSGPAGSTRQGHAGGCRARPARPPLHRPWCWRTHARALPTAAHAPLRLLWRREILAEGEEVIRVGKLYLVDLAGSENISRWGAGGQAGVGEECRGVQQA